MVRTIAPRGGRRRRAHALCRANTAYADESNLDLLATALGGLAEKFNLKGEKIDEVMGGAVITHSQDFNLAREAVLDTSSPAHARHHADPVPAARACRRRWQRAPRSPRARSTAASPPAPTRCRTRRSCCSAIPASAREAVARKERRREGQRVHRASRLRELTPVAPTSPSRAPACPWASIAS